MSTSPSAPLIALDRATKVFSTADVLTYAVRDVTLQISSGDLLAIVGPSGSGKSTLLSLIGLLARPTAGEVSIGGMGTARLPAADRSRLRNRTFSYVFQSFNLIPHLTALENVELPLVYRNARSSDTRDRCVAMLQRVGLGHRLKHLPSQLSGGEQQRIAIARALVAKPKAVLADEPTGNLDSKTARAVLDLLLGMHAEGIAVVFVTHDLGLASSATRCVEILDGGVADSGGAALERAM